MALLIGGLIIVFGLAIAIVSYKGAWGNVLGALGGPKSTALAQ